MASTLYGRHCWLYSVCAARPAWPSSDEEEEDEGADGEAEGSDVDYSDSEAAAGQQQQQHSGPVSSAADHASSGPSSLQQSMDQLQVGERSAKEEQQQAGQHQPEQQRGSSTGKAYTKERKAARGASKPGNSSYMDESMLPPSYSESESEDE